MLGREGKEGGESGAVGGLVGVDTVSDLSSHGPRSHEMLCSLMRWGDAMPKVELRYDDDSPADQLLHGVTPVRAIVLYPASFAALRERFCEGGDAAFTASQNRSRSAAKLAG